MQMSQLHPCSSCSRHVKKTEAACPFCGAALALAVVPARAKPTTRMGRGATFAFGAAVATSVAACSSPTVPASTDANTSIDSGVSPLYGGPPDDAGADGGLQAMYGGPPDTGVDAATPEVDSGGPVPAYGGPFPSDDAATAQDAGGAAPLYGAPPE
jgi:hypothetical protein